MQPSQNNFVTAIMSKVILPWNSGAYYVHSLIICFQIANAVHFIINQNPYGERLGRTLIRIE